MKKFFTFFVMAMVAMSMQAAELVVADGTATSQTLPIRGYYGDDVDHRTQVIYPASYLQDLNGKTITAFTFHVASKASKALTAIYSVSLAEIADSHFTGSWSGEYSFLDVTGTKVYEGTIDASQETITLTFDVPFEYAGGNLFVDFKTKTKGSYDDAAFLGIATSETQGIYGKFYVAGETFLPKTTIAFEGEAVATCIKPTELNEVSKGADFVEVAWTAGGDETQWQALCIEAGETPEWEKAMLVATPSAKFENLQPTTDYIVYVRSFCAEDRQSQAELLDVHTDCAVLSVLPWSEDFESAASNAMPECWVRAEEASSPYVAVYGGYLSAKSLLFNLAASDVQVAALPEFDLGYDTLAISFWYNTGEYNASIEIGYIDAEDAFVAVGEAYPKTKDFTFVEHARLTDIPATAQRLAFRVSAPEAAFLYVDDVLLEVAQEETLEAISNTEVPASHRKHIRNGMLVIEYNGQTFDALGNVIK